jgi:histidine ammonia-lyase
VVIIDGNSLTIEKMSEVARDLAEVCISKQAKKKIRDSRNYLEKLLRQGRVIYGVNTGFGAFANKRIPPAKIRELQVNLLRSTAAGVGENLPTEIVRAMMTMRANTLTRGYSGVRLETIELLTEMLNKRVHPVVPAKGSVGASGDLAPLAHMALSMIGEGEAEVDGQILAGERALHQRKLKPLKLSHKEGLGLINGTELMTSIGAIAVRDAEILIKTAEIAASMSLEAVMASLDPFDARIHAARPHPGQQKSAENIRTITKNSHLLRRQSHHSEIDTLGNIQDAYSLRCIAQVLGPTRDTLTYVRGIIETELNSATDNPLVFAQEGEVLSGGNFHGQPISIAMDILSIGLANIGNIAERRIARLLDEKLNNGLPAFLTDAGKATEGLHSGYMVAQYTAASLVSESKILASPASVDSIPTSANQEDLNSMGTIAAMKARTILKNIQTIVAIELIIAAQALEFRGPSRAGLGTRVAYKTVRSHIPRLKEDRTLRSEIELAASKLVGSGLIVERVSSKAGKLN